MTTPSSVTAAPDETDFAGAVAAAVAGVEGVHALGRSLERASNALRECVGLTSLAPGVKVERDRGGPPRVAVSVVVDYPHKLKEVADAVREAARGALVGIGLDHAEVVVRVTDVWGPFDTEPAKKIEPAEETEAAEETEPADKTEAAEATDPAHTTDAEVVADTLTDVAEAVAHAAEDVRSAHRNA